MAADQDAAARSGSALTAGGYPSVPYPYTTSRDAIPNPTSCSNPEVLSFQKDQKLA